MQVSIICTKAFLSVRPDSTRVSHSNPYASPTLLPSSRLDVQVPLPIIPGSEECITQHQGLNAPHLWICRKLRIHVEEDGHVYAFSSFQPLLLEAEALDLGEVGRHLARRHGVCGDTNDVFGAVVRGRVEGQGGLAGQDAHFALLRREAPGESRRYRAVEGDTKAFGGFDGGEVGGGVEGGAARPVGWGADGLATPAGCLADLWNNW